MKQLSLRFSQMANRAEGKIIQQIVELVDNPNVISFAGGLPPEDAFPQEEFKEVMAQVLDGKITKALQYTSTYGFDELRVQISGYYKSQGSPVAFDEILVVSASQQALDLISKCFINPGDKIICQLPSYVCALDTFRSYGAELIGIPMDNEGMRIDILEDRLDNLALAGQAPKFIYIIPDFQNPTGLTTSLERRQKIVTLAQKHNLLIIEDSPNRELRYAGQHQPRFMDLAGTDYVITLGTLTKLFVPGIRIGWVAAAPEIIEKLMLLKQTTDICSSTLSQIVAVEFFKRGLFEGHLEKIKDLYRDKQQNMIDALTAHMPKFVSWTKPEGGLFLFLHLSENMSARHLLEFAVKRHVVFVPGDVFHCDGSGEHTLRLNFSYPSKEMATKGIKRLAEAIDEYYQVLLNRPQQEHYAPLEDFKSFEQIY